jgi:hypothetical protein
MPEIRCVLIKPAVCHCELPDYRIDKTELYDKCRDSMRENGREEKYQVCFNA